MEIKKIVKRGSMVSGEVHHGGHRLRCNITKFGLDSSRHRVFVSKRDFEKAFMPDNEALDRIIFKTGMNRQYQMNGDEEYYAFEYLLTLESGGKQIVPTGVLVEYGHLLHDLANTHGIEN